MIAGVPFASVLTAAMLLLGDRPDRRCPGARSCGGLALLTGDTAGDVFARLDGDCRCHG